MIFLFSFGFSLFFPLMNGSVILTPAAPPISPFAPSSGERGCGGAQAHPFACCCVWFGGCLPHPAPLPPRRTVRGTSGRKEKHPPASQEELGTGSPASSAQVVRGSWGCSGPVSTLPTHQPASPGKRGVFCACLPPPAPAQGSSVLERGMWGGQPWDLSVTRHHTDLTPSPPIRCLYTPLPETHPAPSQSPRPAPTSRVCLRSPFAHLVAVRLSLSLGLSPSPSTCLPVCLVLCLSSPSTSLCSAVSPSFPTCPHPWLASSPHAGSLPLSICPNLPRLWPGGTHPAWRGGLGRAALALALA